MTGYKYYLNTVKVKICLVEDGNGSGEKRRWEDNTLMWETVELCGSGFSLPGPSATLLPL